MTTFHVRHDLNPQVAREALLLLRFGDANSSSDFLKAARERDLEIGRRKSVSKVLASLRDLGLVKKPSEVAQRGQISLTELGSRIANVAMRDELLLAELIHLRYWWLFLPLHPPHYWGGPREGRGMGGNGPGFAWAYQTVSNTLWEASPTPVERDRLVAIVLASAGQVFDVNGISFSSSSVLGILHWLKALSPPCIIDGEFRRRPSCSPEALVIALEGCYAAASRPLGVPLYLDAAVRERVCRATLLDHEGFDDVLSEAEYSFDLTRYRSSRGEVVLIRDSLFPGLIPSKN